MSAFAYRVPPDTSIHFGVTSNISESGMCVFSDVRPYEGEHVELRSCLPVHSTKASVRWVRKDVGGLYRIGLMFIE